MQRRGRIKKPEVATACAKEKRPDTIHNPLARVFWVSLPLVNCSSIYTVLHGTHTPLHGFLFRFRCENSKRSLPFPFPLEVAETCSCLFPPCHTATKQSVRGREKRGDRSSRRAGLVANRISLFFQFISFPSHFLLLYCAYILCVCPFVFTNWIVRKEVSDFLSSYTHTHTHTVALTQMENNCGRGRVCHVNQPKSFFIIEAFSSKWNNLVGQTSNLQHNEVTPPLQQQQ